MTANLNGVNLEEQKFQLCSECYFQHLPHKQFCLYTSCIRYDSIFVPITRHYDIFTL